MAKQNVQRMSALGLALLAEYEGTRLRSYRDSAGLLTIGVGHLITDHDRMIWQDRRLKGGHYIISESEMLTLLRSDVARVEGAIESRKGEYWHNRNMLDSIASFCFNVGTGVLKRDWMQELIETESIALMEDHWPKWNKAGGKVIRGLTVRRAAEVVWAKKGMVAKGGRESG